MCEIMSRHSYTYTLIQPSKRERNRETDAKVKAEGALVFICMRIPAYIPQPLRTCTPFSSIALLPTVYCILTFSFSIFFPFFLSLSFLLPLFLRTGWICTFCLYIYMRILYTGSRDGFLGRGALMEGINLAYTTSCSVFWIMHHTCDKKLLYFLSFLKTKKLFASHSKRFTFYLQI